MISTLMILFDDIAILLDDVAILSKVAVKKTAGVLGDDLALTAEQVAGVSADRELPVIWAVAKGSLRNKLILVPSALAISAFLPWLIGPLLVVGGSLLCYEGAKKVLSKFFSDPAAETERVDKLREAIRDPGVDMVLFEKEKIKGAIRTDFILSAEVIVIALGVVEEAAFPTRAGVVSVIALGMTVLVYLPVMGIVKIDDLGLYFARDGAGAFRKFVGRWLLRLSPLVLRTLTVVGTVAMFLVGGGILVHELPYVASVLSFIVSPDALDSMGMYGALISSSFNGIFGFLCGGILVVVIHLAQLATSKVRARPKVGARDETRTPPP